MGKRVGGTAKHVVCACLCNCVCVEGDVWHDTAGGRAVPPSVWVVGRRGLDNGECQAMWIKAVGL